MEGFLVELKEIRLRGETVYSGKILTVQEDFVALPDGNEARREVVRHNGACCVVAIDDDKNLLLVRQFRYALNKQLLELPAGKLDVIGESPLGAAKRELLEETGFKAANWLDLGAIYPSPGYCDEVIYLYVATNLTKAGNLNLDEGKVSQLISFKNYSSIITLTNNKNIFLSNITIFKEYDYKTFQYFPKSKNLCRNYKTTARRKMAQR